MNSQERNVIDQQEGFKFYNGLCESLLHGYKKELNMFHLFIGGVKQPYVDPSGEVASAMGLTMGLAGSDIDLTIMFLKAMKENQDFASVLLKAAIYYMSEEKNGDMDEIRNTIFKNNEGND